MHCVILANDQAAFPPALLPLKGRAVIDYLLDDVLKQKAASQVTIITSSQSFPLISKHITNAFPGKEIEVIEDKGIRQTTIPEQDVMVLRGTIFTSLKLQDFIRYFNQFKTITKAAHDKLSPREIPFSIIPKTYVGNPYQLPEGIETHTYNCGSGYCYDLGTKQGYENAKSNVL